MPLYGERLRAGIHPEDVRSLGDCMRLLPLLSKDDVRRHLFFDLFADDHDKGEMRGSRRADSPASRSLRTPTAISWRCALPRPFVRSSDGLAFRRPAGAALASDARHVAHAADPGARRRVVHAPSLRSGLRAVGQGPESLDRHIERIRRHDPHLLDGYAESLNFIAHYLRTNHGAALRPRAVLSSAQTLPARVRHEIETSLGASVFDKYGSREFSGIAYQCEVGAAYQCVMDESYVVEPLRDGRLAEPGEVGEVVATDLNNFSVPLIRYRIGDLATAVDESVPCPCGRGLSRIGEIQGRTQAIVHCADGTAAGRLFSHFFRASTTTPCASFRSFRRSAVRSRSRSSRRSIQ